MRVGGPLMGHHEIVRSGRSIRDQEVALFVHIGI